MVYDIVFDGTSESPWLIVVASPFVALSLVLTVGWRRLSLGAVTAIQYTILVIFIPIVVLSTLIEPTHEASAFAWPWYFQPAAVAFAAVRLRLWAALCYLLVSTAIPLAVTLLTDGLVTEALVGATVRRIGLVVVIGLVYAVRKQLREYAHELTSNEQEQAALARERAQRLADETYRSTVHDHVLGTLLSIVHTQGRATDGVRAEAQATLALGTAEIPLTRASDSVDMPGWGDELSERIRKVNDSCSTTVGLGSVGRIPRAVADAIADAAIEAVRNATRHNAAGATIVVTVEADDRGVRVTVVDNGRGFDVDVATDRLGVRESILNNVNGLPGASASIESVRGSGTRVHLDWMRR